MLLRRSSLGALWVVCLTLVLVTGLAQGQRLSSRGRAQIQFSDMTNAQLSQYLANLTPRLMLNAFLTLEEAQRAEAIHRTQSQALGVVVTRIEDQGIDEVFSKLASDSAFNLYASVQDRQALARLGFANDSAWQAFLEDNAAAFMAEGDSIILDDGLLNLLRTGPLGQRYLQARGADRYDDLVLKLTEQELRRYFFLVDEEALLALVGMLQRDTLAELVARSDVEALAFALSSAPPASAERLVKAALSDSSGSPRPTAQRSRAKLQQSIGQMGHGQRAAELLRRVPALREGLDVAELARTMRPSAAAAFLLSAPPGLDTAPFFVDPGAERRLYDFINALDPLERALMFLDIDDAILNGLLGQATPEERALWLDEAPAPIIATLLNRAEDALRADLIGLLPPDILAEVVEGTDDADLLNALRDNPALAELDIPWDDLLAFFDDPWAGLDDSDALTAFLAESDAEGRAALLQAFGLRALLELLPAEALNGLLAEADPDLLETERANLNDYQALRLLAQADPVALAALGEDEASRDDAMLERALALVSQGAGPELARALLDLPPDLQARALAESGYEGLGDLLDDLTPGQAQAFALSLRNPQAWDSLNEQASDQALALLSSASPLVIAASLEAMTPELRRQVAASLPSEALAEALAWFSDADDARDALEANPQAAALLADEQDEAADSASEDDAGDDDAFAEDDDTDAEDADTGDDGSDDGLDGGGAGDDGGE